ncbi:PRC-barrel domain-containing protein [uncultured Jannaschia sp.]|uniref:PRC-barrel domain-containing protein n=1 Tax=uncultured Jannaschia sp. TaxID=293347 RepID=UPI002631D02C|nr:PRC-barrel domain-containing protein [uncultured Jannaschia sp.]
MRHRLFAVCILPFACGSVAAQGIPVEIPDNLTDAASIASAAKSLSEIGMDKLLIKDLIGKKLTGGDGNTVGTIENFVVVPGGRVIAALISSDDGTTIAVPYAAIKVANAAGTASANVSVPATELQGMSELRSLADSMTD